jgi:hypothetical protein
MARVDLDNRADIPINVASLLSVNDIEIPLENAG